MRIFENRSEKRIRGTNRQMMKEEAAEKLPVRSFIIHTLY
jgi:hypothetical protein